MRTDPLIVAYGCTSSAGPTTAHFWKSLCDGVDHSADVHAEDWPAPAHDGKRPRACLWRSSGDQENLSSLALLTKQLVRAWSQASEMLDPSVSEAVARGDRLGVILASTKGMIDDFVWESESDVEPASDPLTPLLDAFLKQTGLRPARSICVSNACASSLSALFLAKLWLAQGDVRHVLVLAADRIGPFVLAGFGRLRALASGATRAFDRRRDGLQLGEAAAAIVLSAGDSSGSPHHRSRFLLEGVSIDAEGHAATRPMASGESLLRACLRIDGVRERPPNLVIAHATGTKVNDVAEDQVFSRLFEHCANPPEVTGTKWCIGHTLGASGAMDVIAACEALSRQERFHLANTTELEPDLRASYLVPSLVRERNVSRFHERSRRVLITSLGFGGVHAAAMVKLEG